MRYASVLSHNTHESYVCRAKCRVCGTVKSELGQWIRINIGRARLKRNLDLISVFHCHQRRLIKRRETVRLSCTKQMGSARSSMRTTHPSHCPPETLIYFDLTVNLVGGAIVVCFVSLLINIAIHTTLWTSQISWSSRARRVISFRSALIGEEMRALHYPIVR